MSSKSHPPLINLSDPQATNRDVSGGKAAALAKLTALGFPVPEGHVLPARKRIDDATTDAIRWVAVDLLGRSGAQKPATMTGPFPRVAVRSSACCEDGEDASFAGMFETFLGNHGPETVLQSVHACMASFDSSRVRTYARSVGKPADPTKSKQSDGPPAGAVLIQRQIDPVWAGVCFTADPESGIEQLTVVEAVRGLGEALVSGKATPWYARFDRRTGRLVEVRTDNEGREAGELCSEDGAFLEVAKQVVSLSERARLALGGDALDIEWAFDGTTLWLLQARPVTTPVFPLPDRKPLTDPEVWFHANFAETIPGPIPVLAWDSMRTYLFGTGIPKYGRKTMREIKAEPIEYLAGRVCWSASFSAGLGLLSRAHLRMSRPIDDTIVIALERLIDEGNLVTLHSIPAIQRGEMLVRLALWGIGFVREVLTVIWRGEKALAEIDKAPHRELNLIGAQPPSELTMEEAWRQVMALNDRFGPVFRKYYPTFFTLVLAHAWGVLSSRWSGCTEAEAIVALDAAPSGTLMMEREMKRLGAALREGGVTTPCAFEELPASLADLVSSYLKEFGHRGPAEQDISQPRLVERPNLAIELALRSTEPPPRGVSSAALKARHAITAEEIIRRAQEKGLRGKLRAFFLRRLRPHAKRMAPVREDGKHLVWMPFLLRYRMLLLRVGEELVSFGYLDHAHDIFHLYVRELNRTLDDLERRGPALREIIARRRRSLEKWRRMDFPGLIRSDGIPVRTGEVTSDGTLAGIGASSGMYEGIARVARSFEEARGLEPQEILVTTFVDPGWTPLFGRAGALVMEVGGIISHGSVVARELGIPAVVGAHGAVNAIRSGQRIRVDGRLGIITVVDDTGAD